MGSTWDMTAPTRDTPDINLKTPAYQAQFYPNPPGIHLRQESIGAMIGQTCRSQASDEVAGFPGEGVTAP